MSSVSAARSFKGLRGRAVWESLQKQQRLNVLAASGWFCSRCNYHPAESTRSPQSKPKELLP